MKNVKEMEVLEGTEFFTVKGYGAQGGLIGGKSLEPIMIERHRPKMDEVLIDILFCGVCHSDIHQVENDWNTTIYPCVPGHEIIGRVSEIGDAVTKYKVGDVVGVGCMIDACGVCEYCSEGHEEYCSSKTGATYSNNGYAKPDGSGFNTFGGYSTHIVVKEKFVLSIPENLDVASAAPILCAGITTYSPLKYAMVKPGDRVGIIGIGGLGHMAVMIAKAMGAQVTAITTQEEKREAALELGADNVLVSSDKEAMKEREASFNFLLCTIPDPFDVSPFMSLVKVHGTLMVVGLVGEYKAPINNADLIFFNRSLKGSLIGGIEDTQEVLQFCADHGIRPHVEFIDIDQVNEAYHKIKNEEVRFRYVINMKSLHEQRL